MSSGTDEPEASEPAAAARARAHRYRIDGIITPETSEQPDSPIASQVYRYCPFWLRMGRCGWGPRCRYRHKIPGRALLDDLGIPVPPHWIMTLVKAGSPVDHHYEEVHLDTPTLDIARKAGAMGDRPQPAIIPSRELAASLSTGPKDTIPVARGPSARQASDSVRKSGSDLNQDQSKEEKSRKRSAEAADDATRNKHIYVDPPLLYKDCKPNSQATRDQAVASISHFWGTADPGAWFPAGLTLTMDELGLESTEGGLAPVTTAQDLTSGVLSKLVKLAKKTKDLAQAHILMAEALANAPAPRKEKLTARRVRNVLRSACLLAGEAPDASTSGNRQLGSTREGPTASAGKRGSKRKESYAEDRDDSEPLLAPDTTVHVKQEAVRQSNSSTSTVRAESSRTENKSTYKQDIQRRVLELELAEATAEMAAAKMDLVKKKMALNDANGR